LDGRSGVAATTSSSSYRKKLRSRGDVADGDRQLGVFDESFDSASHDNSHDVAAGSSSDAAALESSSQDGSSSNDLAAVVNSNESFDSASHDNSHDVASASSADCASITDTVCAMEGVTFFCDVLKEMMLIPVSTSADDNNKSSSSSSADTDTDTISDPAADTSNLSPSKYVVRRHLGVASDDSDTVSLNDESEEFTLFVPTDTAFAQISTAFEQLSDKEAGRVIMFHLYSGMMLTSDQLACGEKIISMNENGDASRTKCGTEGNKYQNGNGNTKTGTMPEIASADIMACNGVIHTLDAVMFPVSLSQLEADASSASADSSDSDETLLSSTDSDDDYDSSDMSNVTASKSVLRGDLFMG